MNPKECKIEILPRLSEKRIKIRGRPEGRQPIKRGLDEETALREAQRCLPESRCESCDLCLLLCPDLALTRNEETGEVEVDYDSCKRCGICAFLCPRGAIQMVVEI